MKTSTAFNFYHLDYIEVSSSRSFTSPLSVSKKAFQITEKFGISNTLLLDEVDIIILEIGSEDFFLT